MLIVNPFATATTAAGRDALVHTLESRFTVDVEHTTHRGHASELGARAVKEGHDAVLVHGGDGTVNEAVNGMLGAPAAFTAQERPQLGVIPGGSANVFARTFGVNADPLVATRQHIGLLESGQHRSIGLAHTADRWFLFNTGMGMDAIVVREMERKRHAGKAATPSRYLWTTVSSFFANATNPASFTAHVPGHDPITGVKFGFVSNTSPWTYLGTAKSAPTPTPASTPASDCSPPPPPPWCATSPSPPGSSPSARPKPATSTATTTSTGSGSKPTRRSTSRWTATTSAPTPS